MPKVAEHSSPRFAFGPLAFAASVGLLLSAGAPARAQSFTQSGANSTTGNPSGLPFTLPSPTSLNFGTDTVYIANGAPGSFSALAGAQLTAGALSIANGGVAIVPGNVVTVGSLGDVTFDGINPTSGIRTTVNIGGSGNRLEVGNWGTGTLTVSGGALLDAASASCTSGCSTFIGNAAGSTGTLNVSGSEVRTLGFTVGQTSVFTTAGGSSFDFGRPGGTTNAEVNVTDGGVLRTERSIVAFNNAGPNGNGFEKANGTVLVSGPGSKWIVTRDTVNNGEAVVAIGRGAGSNGLVTVSDGGMLWIDGTGSSGPNAGVNIGSGGGGKGKLVVTGAGSKLQITEVNPFINVGGNSTESGNGTFEILAGATASTLFLNVGRSAGTGVMKIDGAGSTLTQSGVGINQAPSVNGAAGASIGRNTGNGGGNGTVTVSNGGQWLISDGGGDGRVAQNSPAVVIGRGANSTGSLTITGALSKVEISSTSRNPGTTVGDNYNPFFGVGYDNPTTTSGTLMVSDRGKLVLTGNALSTGANPRATHLAIGGRNGAAGTGTVTVTGAGSEIIVQGQDALITVGRTAGGSGRLDVLAGGKVSGTLMLVGTGTLGTVNIDNAQLQLAGRYNDVGVGAGLAVGRDGGTGILNMSNGASISINPDTFVGGGLGIGGTNAAPGGTGTVTLSGGSSITLGGTVTSGLNVGFNGTGTLSLSGASFVNAGSQNDATFGRTSTGDGTLDLKSESVFSARQIFLGGSFDTVAGGRGTGVVNGLGSELKAVGSSGFIGVGLGPGSDGMLTVTNQGKVTGTVLSVGRSGGIGTLSADSATIEMSGQQTASLLVGARLSVGTGGGTGTATLNNSTITVRNAGSDGAAVFIGGSGNFPTGTGTMTLSGGSQLTVAGATGAQANVTVGRDGTGTLNLAGGSTVKVGSDSGSGFVADGNVYVGRQSGGVGLLNLSGGSTVNAGFVGVGINAAGTGKALGTAGGTGVLDLGTVGSEGTIVAPRFELGYGSTLKGSGTINAGPGGEVVIGGTIGPGNSPGRIRIYCDVTMLLGSQLVLEVDGSGVNLDIDQLIIGNDSTFDLTQLKIIFAFVGDTNPNDVDLDLNRFLRTSNTNSTGEDSLAALFGEGQDWGDIVGSSLGNERFAFQSSVYDVTSFNFDPETGRVTDIKASEIPEPATYALVLLALVLMSRRQRRIAAMH